MARPQPNERVLSGNLTWGVSCLCASEEQMGVLLGAMTVLGCANIAWEPIRSKDPARVAAGHKSAAAARASGKRLGRPKGRRSGVKQRKPAEAVGAAFLSHHPGKFGSGDLSRALVREGYSSTRAFGLITAWKKAGTVKRTGPGEYTHITRKAA